MGSALAWLFAKRHDVRLFFQDPEDTADFQRTRRSKRLAGVDMPKNVIPTSDIKQFTGGANLVVLVPPSQAFRSFSKELMPFVGSNCDIMSASKGLERGTNQRMTEILLEADPTRIDHIAVLSGPNLAKEIARSAIAGTVIAAYNLDTAGRIQSYLMPDSRPDRFRVYISEDVVGVELGGALKNVMALGAGIADGLGVVSSTKALYFTRALEEMVKFGTSLDACEETFRGLAVVGDLFLSCCGESTRNYRAGLKIAQGQSAEEILSSELAEGLHTIKSAIELAKIYRIDTPIMSALYAVIYEGLDIAEGIERLMGRQPTKEHLRDKGPVFQLARLGMRALCKVGINPKRSTIHI